ncbi:hypothetical protein CsatB_015264 [Cannabis sativa]
MDRRQRQLTVPLDVLTLRCSCLPSITSARKMMSSSGMKVELWLPLFVVANMCFDRGKATPSDPLAIINNEHLMLFQSKLVWFRCRLVEEHGHNLNQSKEGWREAWSHQIVEAHRCERRLTLVKKQAWTSNDE